MSHMKFIERGKFLLEISGNDIGWDFIIHWGDQEVFWFRRSFGLEYFELIVWGRRIVRW